MAKPDPVGAVRAALEDLREEMRAEIERQLAPLRAALEDLRRPAAAKELLEVGEACERYSFSRSTWARWLADPATGLEPDPRRGVPGVVIRPNGPGGKVLVRRAELEAWLAARGRGGPGVAPARS